MALKLVISITLMSFVTLCYSASVSYNQIGDIKISYDGKTFICDKITCPESATRCIVTKKNVEGDRSQIERWARCLGEKDQILMDDRKVEPNPIPNANVDVYVEHGMHGIYSLYNDTEAQRVVDETLREVERNLERVQQDLQRQFKQLQRVFE